MRGPASEHIRTREEGRERSVGFGGDDRNVVVTGVELVEDTNSLRGALSVSEQQSERGVHVPPTRRQR